MLARGYWAHGHTLGRGRDRLGDGWCIFLALFKISYIDRLSLHEALSWASSPKK